MTMSRLSTEWCLISDMAAFKCCSIVLNGKCGEMHRSSSTAVLLSSNCQSSLQQQRRRDRRKAFALFVIMD